jgi:hypothetical protein
VTATTTTSLAIPVITDDMSTLDAAYAYANAGFYIGPEKRGTKNPGSILGDDWQRQTSRDPQVIAGWFAGTDHGIFLHVGRSGAWVADVDNPDKLHPAIQQAISQYNPPYQSTRPKHPGRGHYIFLQPEGRMLGNSLGDLAKGWGEGRGLNGVIIAAPSKHEKREGCYQWRRTGPVPAMPGYMASQMPDAMEAAEAATDEQVTTFLAQHTSHIRPDLLAVHCASFQKKVAAGESRHHTMTGPLSGAMKEAAADLLDAKAAADTLESVFLEAVAQPPVGPKQGKARTGAVARNEWAGLLSWAIAQGLAADPTATRERVNEKVPPPFTEAPFEPNGSTPKGDSQPHDRPRADVRNSAHAADWLRDELGRGQLSGIFRRDDLLVHTPRIGEEGYLPPGHLGLIDAGPAQVRPITTIGVKSLIETRYQCWRTTTIREGAESTQTEVAALFPQQSAQSACEAARLGEYTPNLKTLHGVTHTPMMRPDGTILDVPGYDPATGFLYLPDPDLTVPTIPDQPTPDQIKAAVELILQPVAEFPFVTDDDRATWIGLTFTPALRPLLPGPYQMGVITATNPGSGKTKLATMIRTIHGGVQRGEMPRDADELRKSITAALMDTTAPVITFDNLTGVVRSSVLEALLTTKTWTDRWLGQNRSVTAANDRLWLATGNNAQFGGDLGRRIATVALNPPAADHHLRTDFRIKNLDGWVQAHRNELLVALLTLARGWVNAGRPAKDVALMTMRDGSRASEGLWSGQTSPAYSEAAPPMWPCPPTTKSGTRF